MISTYSEKGSFRSKVVIPDTSLYLLKEILCWMFADEMSYLADEKFHSGVVVLRIKSVGYVVAYVKEGSHHFLVTFVIRTFFYKIRIQCVSFFLFVFGCGRHVINRTDEKDIPTRVLFLEWSFLQKQE